MAVFIGLYIVLGLTCFAYWFSIDRQEGVFRLFVILFLPFLGYLLFFFLWLKERGIVDGKKPEYLQYNEENTASAQKRKEKSYTERILDLVPMEEALLINDNHSRRKQLLDILKSDMTRYPLLLKKALCNEDTETSHYAAAGIVEIKRKLLMSVQESRTEYENSKDRNTFISYAYALKAYQGCGLLDEASARKAGETYQKLIEKVLEFYCQEREFFIDCINHEIEAGEYELAAFYCKKFMEAYSQEEHPYLMYLKLFYRSGDRISFNDMLELLEKSTVCLSSNTWDIIKFWTEVYS